MHVLTVILRDAAELSLTTVAKLLANVVSWFTFYCITRTLSNSIEACLTPVVLYYWMLACEARDIGKKRK